MSRRARTVTAAAMWTAVAIVTLALLETVAPASGALLEASDGGHQGSQPPRRPNLLFIMSDDHALRAISAYDDTLLQTKHIDRLAKEGVKFENAFVTNSLCGPSRAVILTGKYSHVNGFKRNGAGAFNESQWTFPKLLRENGYFTALVGKYHLESFPSSFDHYCILDGQGEYFQPPMFNNSRNRVVVPDVHITDLLTEEVVNLIATQTDKPWLIMMHHKAPHRNHAAPTRYLGHFKDRVFPLPATFFDTHMTQSDAPRKSDNNVKDLFWSFDLKLNLPEGMHDPKSGGLANFDAHKAYDGFLGRLNATQREEWDAFYTPLSDAFFASRRDQWTGPKAAVDAYQRFLRDYLQSVVAVDDSVGRVLEVLDNRGLTNDTVVVYTSDQGFFLGNHGFFDKRFMYEEALRTPLLVRYPPMVSPGSRIGEMVLNLDFAATLAELAGTVAPQDVQGKSFVPLLRSAPCNWRKSIYYHYYEYPGAHNVRRHFGVRSETHKLIHFYGADIEAFEMYDLRSDPQELINLYGLPQFAADQALLENELARLRREFKDTEPAGILPSAVTLR